MARKGKTQELVEYAAVRVVLAIFGLLPRGVSLKLAGALSRLGYSVLGRLRSVGMRNLEIAFPEKTLEERAEILRGTFASLGRLLAEFSRFPRVTPAELERLIDFGPDNESLEPIRRLQAEGRGVLITTAHLGVWEMLFFGLAAIHEPISGLARPLDNALIEALAFRIRTRFGTRPINKTHAALPAIRLLRAGGVLGILSDVNAHPKEGVFVPFFGVAACTASGAAVFALRSNAAIYPLFCVWDDATERYKFVHGKLIEPARTGDRDRDTIETTAAYTAEIEKAVRKYPDQWMWVHRRWKTRPPGEKELY
jgi:KDO2-lipid IV(A) lauroyltransferase